MPPCPTANQAIRTEPTAFGLRPHLLAEADDGVLDLGLDEDAGEPRGRSEQRRHLCAQFRIAGADRDEPGSSFAARPFEGLVKERLDATPVSASLMLYDSPEGALRASGPDISRWSQASARRSSLPHGRDRNPERLPGFLYAEAAEKPQLDHLGFAWVDDRQRIQRIVERFDLALGARGKRHHVFDRYLWRAAATLRAPLASLVVDENLAHQCAATPKKCERLSQSGRFCATSRR
jgi:hypothetical protein